MQVVRRSVAPTRVLPDGNRQWIGHGDRLKAVTTRAGLRAFVKLP